MAGSAQAVGDSILRLQRSAGNQAVMRLLERAPSARKLLRQPVRTASRGITVHPASKLSAGQIATTLRNSAHVPDWLKKRISSKRDSLVLSGSVAQPADTVPQQFVESFNKAFEAGRWQLTTGRLEIKASGLMDPSTDDDVWRIVLKPDLAQGEQFGRWSDKFGFSGVPMISKGPPEVDYGQTPGLVSTNLLGKGVTRGYVVIVSEINVTAPNGKTGTFKPSDDNIAESVIHEISAHAGQIEMGLPSEHHTGHVESLTDEVNELFRPGNTASPLTRQIFDFVRQNG